MNSSNKKVFSLLQRTLSSLPEDTLFRESDIVEFYKNHKCPISERTARTILKKIYPDLSPKVKKERFLATKVINKFILNDVAGTSLENMLEVYQIERITSELSKRNIYLHEQTIKDIIKKQYSEIASKWINSDLSLNMASLFDKMSDIYIKMQKLETISLFQNDPELGISPKAFFKEMAEDKRIQTYSLESQAKHLSILANSLGIKDYAKTVAVGKAEIVVENLKASLSQDEKDYLESRLSILRLTSSLWASSLKDYKGRIFVAKGGRGGGKSYEVAKDLIERSLREKNTIFLCIRETKNVISDSSLSSLKRIISDFELERFFKITNHTLFCSFSNSTFVFRGTYNAENAIKSIDNIKYAWIDEAQLISQEFWDILNPTLRRDDSQIFITYNPRTEQDPVYQSYVKNPRKDSLILNVNLEDNAYASQSLYKEREYNRQNMSEDDYHWIWEGGFLKHSEDLVFKGKFFIEETPLPPPDTQFYYGIDWGDRDPTAMVRCWVRDLPQEKSWELIVDRCFYSCGATIEIIVEGIRSVLGDDEEALILSDHNEPITVRQLKDTFDFNIGSAKKGNGSIQGGIRLLKSFKRIVIDNSDLLKNVAIEFNTYRYKKDSHTGELSNLPEDKNNHAIDAIRYALSRFKKDHPLRSSKKSHNIYERMWK